MAFQPTPPQQRMTHRSKRAPSYRTDQPVGEIGPCDANDGVTPRKPCGSRHRRNHG